MIYPKNILLFQPQCEVVCIGLLIYVPFYIIYIKKISFYIDGTDNIINILKSRGIVGENAHDDISIDTIKNSIDEKWDDIRNNYTVDTFFFR